MTKEDGYLFELISKATTLYVVFDDFEANGDKGAFSMSYILQYNGTYVEIMYGSLPGLPPHMSLQSSSDAR